MEVKIDDDSFNNVIASYGYNANAGFYRDNEWVDFPEEVVDRLTFLTLCEVSWKMRLKFLFTGLTK